MENIKKVRDLYDCEPITCDEKLYPLQKWYNQLIEKTFSEITVADVLKMIRQEQFIKLAMSKAIKYMQDDVFTGELYEGEMLKKVSEMDSAFLVFYANDLKSILKSALEKSAVHEWSYDGEEDEFKEIVNTIASKLP